jgi:hypothetical protein
MRPRSRTPVLIVLTTMAALAAHGPGRADDRLTEIIRGGAFGELGGEGQAVALFLAATEAPTWEKAQPLLERIWKEYPDSTAVDVAHWFAARHYRDSGEPDLAREHLAQALQAARQRNRTWADYIAEELRAADQAAAETKIVKVDATIGQWTPEPRSTVEVEADGSILFETEFGDDQRADVANLRITRDIVATGARFRFRPDKLVRAAIVFLDADGTMVVQDGWEVKPGPDGWSQVDVDFSKMRNQGGGDHIMRLLAAIGISLWRPEPRPGGKVQVALRDLELRTGSPVRTADAPAGWEMPPLRTHATDEHGSGWASAGWVQIAADPNLPHEGEPSIRMSIQIEDLERPRSGSACVLPPAPGKWRGERLVFWCYPHDVPFLPIIINSVDHTQLSAVVGPEQLKVGEWNRVEVDLAKAAVGVRYNNVFSEARSVVLFISPQWDAEHAYFRKAGRYTFNIADLHFEGEGPVQLPVPKPSRPPALTDENGTFWGATVPAKVDVDTEVVHEGRTSMRLSVQIDPTDPKGSGGWTAVRPPAGEHWLGDKLVFWCYPRDAAFLPIIANDPDRVQLFALVGPDQLKVGQWNHVEVDLRSAPPPASRAESFGEISSIYIVPHSAYDQERRYLTKAGEYVWYIEDVHAEGQGPISFVQRTTEVPDVGADIVWTTSGDCAVEPDAKDAGTGAGSAKVTVRLTPDERSGGTARLRRRDGKPWTGTDITFACRAVTAAFLDVMAVDSDGTLVVWHLRNDELRVGEWRTVHLSSENMMNLGAGDDRMDDIARLVLVCERRYDPQGRTLPKEGPVVWLIDDFAVSGGPALLHKFAAWGAKALRDDTGDDAEWAAFGRAHAEPELVIVREGGRSIKLTLFPERPGARGSAGVEIRPAKPRRCDALTLWVWPNAAGPFAVVAYDAESDYAVWNIAAERLSPRTWNQLTLLLSDATVQSRAGSPAGRDELGPVTRLMLPLSQLSGTTDTPATWYLDSLSVLTEEEAP